YIFQADILIGASANYLQDTGIGMFRADASNTTFGDWKGPQVNGGGGGNYGTATVDKSWDNTNHTWNFSLDNGTHRASYTPIIANLQLDYGYTTPGKFTAWVKIPVASDRGTAANTWSKISNNTYDAHPSDF